MKFTVQKRLAASVLGCSADKVWFDNSQLEKIKEAITRADVRSLINSGLIQRKADKGISRGRARKRHTQKQKGRQKGQGKRKGKKTARAPKKRNWINKVRTQRNFLKDLKEHANITNTVYRSLYSKSKGGFFRSKRHIKLYLEEHKLFKKK